MTTIAIYLAGSIKKDHEMNDFHWTQEDLAVLKHCLADYHLCFLNPALRSDSLSDQFSVFGRDMLQVFSSDVVFVDARERRGLGVGAEMMWAKMNDIPVVTLAPRQTHYHKQATTVLGEPVQNWIHPFVESLSDHIVENLEAGAEWIKLAAAGSIPIKGREFIHRAMQYYVETQLDQDHPMQELTLHHPTLFKRFEQLSTFSK